MSHTHIAKFSSKTWRKVPHLFVVLLVMETVFPPPPPPSSLSSFSLSLFTFLHPPLAHFLSKPCKRPWHSIAIVMLHIIWAVLSHFSFSSPPFFTHWRSFSPSFSFAKVHSWSITSWPLAWPCVSLSCHWNWSWVDLNPSLLLFTSPSSRESWGRGC